MDDEQAIRDVVDRWMIATKAGDTQAVLDLMTDDVVFMVPGREPFGKEEFRAASEAMEGMEIDGRAEIRELRVLGDWAFIHPQSYRRTNEFAWKRNVAPRRLHADDTSQMRRRPLATCPRRQPRDLKRGIAKLIAISDVVIMNHGVLGP
jgi:hypothetical protein